MLPLPGAVAASGPDTGVAAHLGDPVREQRALERGRGIAELPARVVTVTGRDRLSWLDTLSSQRVRDLAPGQGAELMLLEVTGRIEHTALLTDDGTTTYLVTETGEALAAFLTSMRFMLDVAVVLEPDLAVLGAVTPDDDLATRLGDRDDVVALVRDPWPGVVEGGTRYALVDDHPGLARPVTLVVVRAREVDAVVGDLLAAGYVAAGSLAWEALRIAAWRPRAVLDADEKALPHELDWLRTAVHLTKGCYRGQEGVARTFNLGRPPRRLVMLHLDGSDHLLPEAGAAVADGDRVVGRVTSVARHHELGPIALAVVRRAVDPATELLVQGPAGPIAASQELVVGADGFGEGRPEGHGPVTPGLRRRG